MFFFYTTPDGVYIQIFISQKSDHYYHLHHLHIDRKD